MTNEIGVRFKVQSLAASPEGRGEAFELVWGLYRAKLLVFFRHLSAEDPEDLVQDTMLKVHANLASYDPRYALSTWIYAIARNVWIDWTSKRRNHAPLSEDHAAAAERDVLVDRELDLLVREALALLDGTDRQIAYLKFSERMTSRQIGTVTGMPAGTVRYRLNEIRKSVRGYLERRGYEAL